MFCKYCGQPQDNDALFCSACGKRINTDISEKIPANPDINSFSRQISDNQPKNENTPVLEEIQPDTLTLNKYNYAEINETPEFNKENLVALWTETGLGTKLLLLTGSVMIIVLFAILMLSLFFPNVKL